ncbi:MAG: hypothetical protein M0T83_08800 [Nitrospiraceae bacterium]|nr:hypothetical protein [Nitrospiraceae bacterium]
MAEGIRKALDLALAETGKSGGTKPPLERMKASGLLSDHCVTVTI